MWLIVARAVQGLGAALLSPAALSLVTALFAEGAERNKALGVWGAVAGSGGAAGVLLGGMLTEWAGWEWVLFVNVPIGIAAALLAPRLLPETRNEGHAPLRHRRRDHASPPASRCSSTRWSTPTRPAGARRETLGLIGVARRAARRLRDHRAAHQGAAGPVPGHLPAPHDHAASTSSALLIAMALFSMFFFISLYMQQVLGYDALKAGFAYLPLAVGIIVSAGVASALVDALRRQAGAGRAACC